MQEKREKLRIVMIGQKGLPPRKDSGGIERHVGELGRRLAARGHEVIAYVRPRFTDARHAVYEGIELRRLPSVPTKHLDTATHVFLASVAALFVRADVIHYHGVGPATFAWIPRLFARRARVIVTFHSIDRFHKKWGWFARMYLRFGEWAAVRFPHRTIAVSRSIQRYCRERYDAEVTYIPNGAVIHPYPGDDLLAQWGIGKEGYVLTAARLVPQKGIHFLIDAYGGIETTKKLVVAGTASLGDEYGAYVRRMGEGDSCVVFVGFQEGRALAQLYANAYLYVHPSEAEGLSISILEAMSAGRCVLVSDIPENVESIDHSGLSFANADVRDLREKLTSLLNHPEIVAERGAKAKAWVAREYDWDRIAAETEKAYVSD